MTTRRQHGTVAGASPQEGSSPLASSVPPPSAPLLRRRGASGDPRHAPRSVANAGIHAKHDRTSLHTRTVSLIRLALGRESDLVLWPNPVKNVEVVTETGLIRMTTGLCRGSSDLVGILAVGAPGMWAGVTFGRFMALEVKTGAGKPEPHQLDWLLLVRARGGFAAVVRDVDDALQALQRARQGAFE